MAANVTGLRGTGENVRRFGLVACLLLAGCGGGDGGASRPTVLPDCARVKTSARRPAILRGDIPVPEGTRYLNAAKPYPGQVLVTAHAPGTYEDVAAFYDDRLEGAGYRQGHTESEAGIEMEALFTGNGVRGGWKARVIPECEGASHLTIVVIDT